MLNNAGNHYLSCGNPDKAREYFERLLLRVPAHLNANLQLARLAVEHKQPARKFLAVLAARGDTELLSEAGTLYARLGDFKQAQQLFQRVAVSSPGAFDPLWNLGRAAARAGDLPRARAALEAALRLKPQDVSVLHELGSAYAASGDFPRAVFLLAQAQKLAPRHPAIALALARAAEDAGFFGDAALAFDRYLQLQPEDLAAKRDRARVVANTPGRRDEGFHALASYVAAHPTDPIGHFQLAQLCWNTEPEKSLSHLAESVRLNPVLAPAHTARAWLLHRHGRDAEALTHLETALRVKPDDVRALDQYGLVLMALDRPADAERAFRRAATLAPADWEVRLHLGRVLMELGRHQEAAKSLEEYQKLRPARQRDPRREPGMIDLATLSAPERRAREIDRFRTMAAARPDDALLRLDLAKLLLADGRSDQASTEFNTLLTMNPDGPLRALAGRALLDAGLYALALPFLDPSQAPLDRAIALLHTTGPDSALAALEQIPAAAHSAEFLLVKARILAQAGHAVQAQRLLASARAWPGARPQLVEEAALLIAGFGPPADAARILAQALADAPDNRDLLLAETVVLALDGQTPRALSNLRRLEQRWPEWDRPYRLHGLLLAAMNRAQDAGPLLRTAAALNTGAPPDSCQSLRDWLTPACRGVSR